MLDRILGIPIVGDFIAFLGNERLQPISGLCAIVALGMMIYAYRAGEEPSTFAMILGAIPLTHIGILLLVGVSYQLTDDQARIERELERMQKGQEKVQKKARKQLDKVIANKEPFSLLIDFKSDQRGISMYLTENVFLFSTRHVERVDAAVLEKEIIHFFSYYLDLDVTVEDDPENERKHIHYA